MTIPPLPWRYPYLADKPRQRELLRPIVSAQLIGVADGSAVKALVDSGCEHVLAAPWLASGAAVDMGNPKYSIQLGIGGENLLVNFVDMRIRLLHPQGDDNHFVEWEAEVGFPKHWRAPWPMLLGQHGFFDRFTISMHRGAGLTIIEEWNAFDERFGIEAQESEEPGERYSQ